MPGKKRVCKYGCGTELEWDDYIKKFRETKDGTEHTPERCKSIKSQKGFSEVANRVVGSTSTTTSNDTLEILLKQLNDKLDFSIAEVKKTIDLLEATLKKLGLFTTAAGQQVEPESNTKGIDAVKEGKTLDD